MSSTHYRLPRNVIPLSYEVDIDASPKRRGFKGVVHLNARVVRAGVDRFELNARDLGATRVTAVNGTRRCRAEVTPHPERETIEITFERALDKGPLRVTLCFAGKLSASMHGLYLAEDGPERAIVSQCEAADARAIFPCFDEPDLKATLQWTVRTDPGLTVITNGVLKSKRKAGKPLRVVHRFEPTRLISTYLAAITIGRLEGTEAIHTRGVPCRVWTGRGKLDQSAFAQEVTAWVLPWYEKYFGQKYNYHKLDQVAVPGFDAGAMENVGAIFYRQNLLLMDPATTSWGGIKRIAEVIAHEIAHQWFGNLVTMKWWDDLWLNEAFATWIAYKACDTWKPSWRMWDDFLESKHSALSADALVNTHPVYSEVRSPAQATELFDIITYEKGCAVLRMVESFLGEEAFRDGIRRYQKAYKNKNAAGADLWGKLEEASGEPIETLMGSWVEQPGFPLITVEAGMVDGRTTLHLGQRRFFANAVEMQKEHDQHWVVPLVIRYDLGNGLASHRAILEAPDAAIALPDEGHARWIYPNAGATGFYRMQLSDPVLRDLLDRGLPHLTPAARSSLLDDQWALVRCGLSNIEQFLDVLVEYRDEHDHVVVRAMAVRVATIASHVVADADRDRFAAFVRWLFGGQLEELGWEPEPNETPERAVRRAAAASVLGNVGRDPHVLRQADALMEAEMTDPTAVEANLAGVVCSLAALRGSRKLLQRYVDTYQQRKTDGAAPELSARYLFSLSAFETPTVAARVRSLCLDGTIPQEQLRTVLVQSLTRRATRQDAWRFLKKNWKQLAPKVGSMGISRLIESTGSLSPTLRDDVAGFFARHPVAEAQRALQQALEAMDLRRELVEREAPRLRDWLGRESDKGAACGPSGGGALSGRRAAAAP